MTLAGKSVVAVLFLLPSACSSPTLEEACQEYCDAAREAHCGGNLPPECNGGCGQLRDQLQGKCIDEYTEVLDCTADDDFICYQGTAVSNSTSCVDEALDLLECMQYR